MKQLRLLQIAVIAVLGISVPFQAVNAKKDIVPAKTSKAVERTPEAVTPLLKGNSAKGSKIMVVTAHPEATRIGYEVLKGGGSAADAAVAVQLVMGLVEPQSSGLGGGGFALYYDAKTKQVHTYDGRETAPKSAGRYLFVDEGGKPMEFYKAAVGGRAVGTPGTVRLLETLHRKFGVKPWRDLFSPAITLAEQGFTVTPRLAALVDFDYDHLTATTATRLYYMPDAATPIKAGTMLGNPVYANTLRSIALNGPKAFYEGPIAESIVKVVREFPGNPGLLSLEDLQNYKVIERKSICGKYRAYMICTAGEPTSGGLVILSALGILENFNLAAMGENNPQAWNLIMEASRLAFADRNEYMGDPGFIQSPGEMLIDPAYLKSRAALIAPNKVETKVQAGMPAAWKKFLPKPAAEPVYPKPPGTTHFCIVDAKGNMVSMTSSVEDTFGSRLMVEGFMLNNQLTDFSFIPEIDKKQVANRVEGGKRPRSSMAPIIVFDPQGAPYLVMGSAGGSAIPGYMIERLVALIDWKKDLQGALAMPNIIHRGPMVEMEPDAFALEQPLRDLGHPLEVKDLNSGLTAIQFGGGQMTGAADPRREGTAMGE